MSAETADSEVPIPPRGNSAAHEDYEEIPVDELDEELPDHLIPVRNPNHTAVCESCRYWITVGPKGTEYGHARAGNKGPNCRGPRVDCEHRPSNVDPGMGSAQ